MDIPDGPLTIEMLAPHRGRMLLLSQIVRVDSLHATATATATEQWPLVSGAMVNPLVLIELAAQTAALNNGLELRERDGPQSDTRGWIVGIKSAQLHVGDIPVGTTIAIESRNVFQYDNFREILAVVRIDGAIAAHVILQLMQADASSKE